MNLTEIGDNEKTNALICHTNNAKCCDQDNFVSSSWRFPNRTVVDNRKTNGSFTRNRRKESILLYRELNSSGPIGIYACEIKDSQANTAQELQVGIYPINEGNCCKYGYTTTA